jgi:hypothetical protein
MPSEAKKNQLAEEFSQRLRYEHELDDIMD